MQLLTSVYWPVLPLMKSIRWFVMEQMRNYPSLCDWERLVWETTSIGLRKLSQKIQFMITHQPFLLMIWRWAFQFLQHLNVVCGNIKTGIAITQTKPPLPLHVISRGVPRLSILNTVRIEVPGKNLFHVYIPIKKIDPFKKQGWPNLSEKWACDQKVNLRAEEVNLYLLPVPHYNKTQVPFSKALSPSCLKWWRWSATCR